MGDFTALNAALASLVAAVTANTAAVSGAITHVGTISMASDQAQVDAAASQVTAAVTQVQANTTGLGALISPPAPVTPASS